MIRALRPFYAVAAITMREALRQRLWLLLAAVILVLAIASARLSAVDEAARLKLAVALVCGGSGFVITLLAILVGAQQVRRDLDARVAFVLFSKPLGRLAYLAGRWSGVVATLGIAVVALAVAGTALVAVQSGAQGLPTMRAVVAASGWQEVGRQGDPTPIAENRTRIALNGAANNGVRWTIGGLSPSTAPADGYELLIRVRVQGTFDRPQETCRALITAMPAGGRARVLAVDAASPYGRGAASATAIAAGEVLLVDRADARNDLGQDWLRLRLPAECVGADGATIVQVTRLDAAAVVTASRDGSCAVAAPGGGFLTNLVRGGLVMLAGAGLLAGATLLLAILGNLGVALLGGLTLFFAGNALGAVRETLRFEPLSTPMRRVLELAQTVLPDLDRHQIGAQLAAGRTVAWSTVGDAWLHHGAYALIFLFVAWFALVRREL